MDVVYHSFTEVKVAVAAKEFTITKPPGVVEGDLMVAVFVLGGPGFFSWQPGNWFYQNWTLLVWQPGNEFTILFFYRIAEAGEPSSYTWEWLLDLQAYGFIMRFTGHDSDNPINVSGYSSSAVEGVSSTPQCPSIVTTEDNCLILRIFGADHNDITVDSGHPPTHTGITVDKSSDDVDSCCGGAAYKQQSNAGATGTALFAMTDMEEWFTTTLAIQPKISAPVEAPEEPLIVEPPPEGEGEAVEELWSDLHHSLATDAQGLIKRVINIDAVITSIDNILRTHRGERVMLPTFGAGVELMLFEGMSETLFDAVASEIREAIEEWDDRVIVNSIDFKGEPDLNQTTIRMSFSVRGYNRVFEYSTPLVG